MFYINNTIVSSIACSFKFSFKQLLLLHLNVFLSDDYFDVFKIGQLGKIAITVTGHLTNSYRSVNGQLPVT